MVFLGPTVGPNNLIFTIYENKNGLVQTRFGLCFLFGCKLRSGNTSKALESSGQTLGSDYKAESSGKHVRVMFTPSNPTFI